MTLERISNMDINILNINKAEEIFANLYFRELVTNRNLNWYDNNSINQLSKHKLYLIGKHIPISLFINQLNNDLPVELSNKYKYLCNLIDIYKIFPNSDNEKFLQLIISLKDLKTMINSFPEGLFTKRKIFNGESYFMMIYFNFNALLVHKNEGDEIYKLCLWGAEGGDDKTHPFNYDLIDYHYKQRCGELWFEKPGGDCGVGDIGIQFYSNYVVTSTNENISS